MSSDGMFEAIQSKELVRTFGYKSFFYRVNQLEIDNSRPPTGTSPSEEMQIPKKKLEQMKKNVGVQPNDPSSPFHSVKSFEELPL